MHFNQKLMSYTEYNLSRYCYIIFKDVFLFSKMSYKMRMYTDKDLRV